MEQASFICCQTKVLLGYLKRELPAVRQAEVSQHLEQCPQCRAVVADLSEVFEKEIKASKVAPLKNTRRHEVPAAGEQGYEGQRESVARIFLVRYAWLSLLIVLLLLVWLVKLAVDREYVKITKATPPGAVVVLPVAKGLKDSSSVIASQKPANDSLGTNHSPKVWTGSEMLDPENISAMEKRLDKVVQELEQLSLTHSTNPADSRIFLRIEKELREIQAFTEPLRYMDIGNTPEALRLMKLRETAGETRMKCLKLKAAG